MRGRFSEELSGIMKRHNLVAQLASGGRLVIPVGEGVWDQVLWLIERVGDKLRRQHLADVRFVPLIATASRSEPEDDATAQIRTELQNLFVHR